MFTVVTDSPPVELASGGSGGPTGPSGALGSLTLLDIVAVAGAGPESHPAASGGAEDIPVTEAHYEEPPQAYTDGGPAASMGPSPAAVSSLTSRMSRN